MNADDSRIAVVGAGLAGCTFVGDLLRRDISASRISLLDARRPGCTSSHPAATFHPLPGNSLAPDRRKLRAASTTIRHLRRWRGRWPDAPIRTFRLVRPLDDGLADSIAPRADYPDWFEIERLTDGALEAETPPGGRAEAAVAYRPACCVDLGALRERHLSSFTDRGVDVRPDASVDRLERDRPHWRCHTSEGSLRVGTVVLAVGAAIGSWFPELALKARGGELLLFDAADTPDRTSAYHDSLHLAPRPGGGLVVGATWWDATDLSDRTDRDARETLGSELERLYPDLDPDTATVWRGIRLQSGDYQPLVGPVPGLDSLHVLAGFGGTGLLSIPRHASALAETIDAGTPEIPELARPDRMGTDHWVGAPARFAPT